MKVMLSLTKGAKVTAFDIVVGEFDEGDAEFDKRAKKCLYP